MTPDELLARWLAGTATSDQVEALATAIAADPAFAAVARGAAQVERLLPIAVRDEATRAAAVARVLTGVAVAGARRRRARLAISGAVAIAAALAVAFTGVLLRDDPAALRIADPGDVRLTRGGVALPAGGARLRPGDALLIATQACELVARDGTRLRLGAGTHATVLDDAHGLRLDDGSVNAQVAHRTARTALRLATPRAVATVIGTRLALAVGSGDPGDADGGDRLSVDEGVVRFGAPGREIAVPAGRSAVIAADGGARLRESLRVDRFTDAIPRGWTTGERARPPVAGTEAWALRGGPEQFAPTANTVCIRAHGWTSYADDLGVDLDVLVTASVPWIALQVYDPSTAQNYAWRRVDPPVGRWLRLSVALRDFAPVLRAEQPMRVGDALDSLYVIAGEVGRQQLWLERMELWRRAR